ncbi:MAG: GNAT family N-acetyltransferase [Candidatus Bathycorpusculaceae bacterium]
MESMTDKVIIRRMHKQDLTVVSELAMLANPHATKEKYAEHILNELKENQDLSLVAVDDGKVIGYAQANVHEHQGILEDIVVAKDYQGRGIGKLLLNKILQTLRRRGATLVLAEVHYKCASAIPFYYKHGFRIIGFMQDYFGIGHDAIILKLVLN